MRTRARLCLLIVVSLLISTTSSTQSVTNYVSVQAYCSTPRTQDSSCLHNALAAASLGTSAVLKVPQGVYRIDSLKIATPHITFKCAPGAILQPSTTFRGISISANDVSFDGCTLDMRYDITLPGILVTNVSGFAFNNGSIIHIGDQSGLELHGTSNAVINHNYFLTTGGGDAVIAYGPTTNIRITNNFGKASTDVVSGRYASGPSNGVYFTGNTLQPQPKRWILETGDFTDGYGPARPVTNIVVSGNTCNIIAPVPKEAPFACFTLVGGYNVTFTDNKMTSSGQYVDDSLLELGTSNSTVSNNTFNIGNDPGVQHYDGIILYGSNVTLTGNIFVGKSAYGSPIHIYPQSNASAIMIAGGSINTGNSFGVEITHQIPGSGYSGNGTCQVLGGIYTLQAQCTVTVTRNGSLQFSITRAGQYTVAPTSITTSLTTHGVPAKVTIARIADSAVSVTCNQRRIPLRVMSISGAGPTGSVTSVRLNDQGYPGAQVGAHFIPSAGIQVAGGSGSGLKLDILSVDSNGGIKTLGIAKDGGGHGYKVGDIIYLPVTDKETAAEVTGLMIGGGLKVLGAVDRGIALENFQGTKCPVTASVSGVTITGPNDATSIAIGIYNNNSKVRVGTVKYSHVMKLSRSTVPSAISAY